MPTYEYECTHCSHKFERFQSIKDEPLKRCPECRHKIKRLLGTGAGIIFKGSGFYETDYRSDNYRKGEKAEKTPETKPDSSAKDSGTKKTPDKTQKTSATEGATKT